MTERPSDRLLGGARLARNTIYNLFGLGTPMIVALFAVPRLVRGLGVDRFGVLSLAWMFLGYFGLFDLGLGQSLTQLVSEKLGTGADADIPAVVWTALSLMFMFGALGSAVLLAIAPHLVHGVLKVPGSLQPETLTAFMIIAASLPLDISTAGLQGVLAAHQRFGAISAVRIVMGLFTFLGPLLALSYSNNLSLTVGVLMLGRIATWLAYLILCLRTMPALREGFAFRSSEMGRLLRFGGWMTVSNVISPLMSSMDRFLVGSLLSVAAVAYYTTPYDMIARLAILPTAMTGVLFPAFSASYALDRDRVASIFERASRYVFMTTFPAVFLIVAFSREILALWLGAGFAAHSARVLQVLGVGMLFNCLARIPFALVQGVGRPDLTAKAHAIELAVYLPVVWWAIAAHGILGAAAAWTARVLLDALILFALSRSQLRGAAPCVRRMAVPALLAVSACAVSAGLTGIAPRAVFVAAALVLFALASSRFMLAKDEKALAQRYLKGLAPKIAT